ncbi:hypothetical protein OCA00_16680 [Bacillus cereus]|nr:hypothetical protein [Bacillus cereus]MCU4857447.1 hypothetical protein [Bacillus cereus]MCU4874192.1 hypothetical protein [Bacillus cereus]MCU4940807.1 hypothetical protein [Bacillus cereus]
MVRNTFVGIVLIVMVVTLSLNDLQTIKTIYIQTLWKNIIFLSGCIFAFLPFLLLILMIFLFSTKKWAFRVEKLTIGGFNVLFDNPEHLFKRQIGTFLNTKRTLFKIDFKHDNFDDTFTSYFETYKLLRDEMKILKDAKKKTSKKGKPTTESYDLSNLMIKELNHFLTKHQSDYRRWYKYMELRNEEEYYTLPIEELQKKYSNYEELSIDFQHVNKFFVNKIAPYFDVDTEKWE